MALDFEWDPRKAAANRRKHGVGFEEAASAFADPLSVTVPISARPAIRHERRDYEEGSE